MSLKAAFPQFPILAVVLLALAVPPAHLDMVAIAHWLLVNVMTLFHHLEQLWRLLSC
jgi:hypothetical protein